jgi:hypothetical protein
VEQTPRSFSPTKLALPLLLALLFGLGAFLRFADLSQPLLDFHPTRQLFSAVKARGMYYQTLPDAPAWQKDLAYRQWQGEATIEPLIVENIALFFYIRFGQENTAYPRAVSAAFWLIAAAFLFLLSKNITNSYPAAFFSLAFFLLLPYAVTASRSFQPDPLMVMLMIIFWWAMERSAKSPGFAWAFLAGLSGGLAIFVKLTAVFFIAAGALGAILAHSSFPQAIKNPKTWLIAGLCILPPAAYLYYGLYVKHFLAGQFDGRFFPSDWVDPYFYLRWFLRVDIVINVPWIALAVLGLLVFTSKTAKIFLSALWGGYILYGLIFPHHIATHDYYSLPLIPIVALCLAPLLADIFQKIIERIRPSGSLRLLTIFLLFFTLLSLTIEQYLARRTTDYNSQAAFWAEVGDAIGHQPGVVAITTDYAYPLAYYGWQNADPWPASVDIRNLDDTWTRWAANKSYFLITDFDEFDRQPELQKRLYDNYPILAQGRGYAVFDLLHPKQ